jgi:hypothetical protein
MIIDLVGGLFLSFDVQWFLQLDWLGTFIPIYVRVIDSSAG